MKHRSDLDQYQIEVIEKIKEKMFCGAFLDMGYGKTVISLTAISDLLDDFRLNQVLVIAPKRVANLVWKQEGQEWSHLKHLNIEICTGDREEKVSQFKKKADIHVTNRETIPYLIENYKFKWDAVIIDESSGFKSHKSERFKGIRKILKNIEFLLELTGTPSPNGIIDLWSQVYLLDKGERLGRNITIYRQRYFKQTGYMGYQYEPNEGSFDAVMEKISDICFTPDIKLEEIETRNIIHKIQLSDKVRDLYDTFEKEFVVNLDGQNLLDLSEDEEADIDAPNKGQLGNKLAQICNGFVYNSEREVKKIHDEKFDALKSIIEDNPNESVVIAYQFIPDMERILKLFPKCEYLGDDQEQLDRWNQKKIPQLVTHAASAGHGLNLQYGGSVLIWFGITWSLELYQQLCKRLARRGQEKLVRIYHLVVEDSIEERMVEALNSKAKTQEEVMEYFRNCYRDF